MKTSVRASQPASPGIFRSAIVAILCFIFSAAQLRAGEPASERYSLMGNADKAIAGGRWAEAEDALRQALRLDPADPTNVLLLSNLGMVQFYDGRSGDAIATLSDAHRIAPASVTVLLNRARVLTSAGFTDQALDDYSEVIRLDSTLTEPRFYRAVLCLSLGREQQAMADIDTLVLRAPDDRLTNIALATVEMRKADFQSAIMHLSSALKDNPDAAHLGSRALCYLMTGDLASASDDIAAGLELDPTDGDLYLYRALLNKMRYRPDDAKADGETAVKMGVDPQKVKMLLQ